jgi:hypothetical protein
MSELQETGAQELPKFDPSKKYTWPIDATITLTGNEFGLIMNALRATISTKEAATIILAHKASEMIDDILVRTVENGIAVETE